MESVKGYIVKFPAGKPFWNTWKYIASDSRKMAVELINESKNWQYLYVRGYRCVKARIVEGWE